MKKISFLFCFIFVLPLFSLAQTKLSRAEKKIVSSVIKNKDEAIQFLEKVVNINSGSLNVDGVRKVGAIFDEEFKSIDFETQWIDMPADMNRAGHLFAETKGSKGKKILLIGHLDTVFEENSPFQKFERISETLAHAPGGNDMKGGDVIILFALKALHDNGLLDDAQIIVAFTGDEESTGKPLSISRKDLIEAGKRSDVALCFETSTGFEYATVARRGASGWELKTSGKRAHSSGVFSERVGAGAIFEMGRILNDFYEEVKGEDLLTFNPGIMLGGTFVDYDKATSGGTAFGKTNVVAQSAIVRGGLRFITEDQKERARAKMREIVSNHLPMTDAEISFEDSYPAMPPKKENFDLLEKLNQVSLALNQGEVKAYDPGKRGAADTSFVANYVAALDGLGTMGSGAHTPNETVNLKTLETLTMRAAILIYRLINENE
jgi:glutamate carboxypeptidase